MSIRNDSDMQPRPSLMVVEGLRTQAIQQLDQANGTVEPSSESQEGEFVAVFRELTELWRNIRVPCDRPVKRPSHLRLVSVNGIDRPAEGLLTSVAQEAQMTHDIKPITPSRRALLRGTAALLACAGAAATPGNGASASNPDAALIQLCEEHIANMKAFNNCPLDSDVSPFWDPYERTLHEINAATPQTMEGVFAIARAAMVHATQPDGSIEPEATMANVWAWNIMNDIARIHRVKL